MNCPEMILFDYGNTLLHEPGFNTLRGNEALMQYVVQNESGLTASQINDFSEKLFNELSPVRRQGYELHQRQYQRLLYEYLGVILSIPLAEAENVFWDAVTPGAPMPGADAMLHYINQRGIRSGVISNISFSGEALARRINRLLPNNRFEFIMASSEYLLRKPHPMLFEVALRKAGLRAGEVWYCGDRVGPDVEGAASAGIFPVWYQELTVENPWADQDGGQRPACPHLHIHTWDELIKTLEKLKS